VGNKNTWEEERSPDLLGAGFWFPVFASGITGPQWLLPSCSAVSGTPMRLGGTAWSPLLHLIPILGAACQPGGIWRAATTRQVALDRRICRRLRLPEHIAARQCQHEETALVYLQQVNSVMKFSGG